MKFSIIAGSLFVAIAQAIQFTSQPLDTVVDQSKTIDITWNTVANDPSTAYLQLVRTGGGAQPVYDFGQISLASGKYSISRVNFPTGGNYQFQFVSKTPQNSGILAQTNQFSITGSAGSGAQTLSTIAAGTATVTGVGSVVTGSSGSSTTLSTTTGTGAGSVSTSSSGNTTVSTGTVTGSNTGTAAVQTRTNAASVNSAGSSLIALVLGAVAAMI